jgi:hypothetical protein
MTEISTIAFTDSQTHGECVVIVRATLGHLTLCVSSISDGDLEVSIDPSDANRIASALNRAILMARGDNEQKG